MSWSWWRLLFCVLILIQEIIWVLFSGVLVHLSQVLVVLCLSAAVIPCIREHPWRAAALKFISCLGACHVVFTPEDELVIGTSSHYFERKLSLWTFVPSLVPKRSEWKGCTFVRILLFSDKEIVVGEDCMICWNCMIFQSPWTKN